MASSVAAKLKQEKDVDVKLASGGLGEFSVSVDGQKVVNTNRLWYPNPSDVVKKVRSKISQKPG